MGQWGIINTIFLSFSCLNNEIMHVKKKCYIFTQSAIKTLYFTGTSAINYSTFAIFFFEE